MLTVKIQYGDEGERMFYVNDILDVKRVQDNILEDFQRVMNQDKSEEKIELERILDASDFDNADDLIEWMHEAKEIKDCLDSSGYDSIDEMTGKLEDMSDALAEIYNISRDYY